ncbi:MAG: hypothetical protein CEN89_319 [Candidatus Berkelbacteria bacterium Licking1014_7]|uniref:Uncharacterized protein n=1 Tax=Candidatus Berkelbacteria bacterium Licking1014_7 TaxID=2017147 RepID=A0A554LKA4_9BACT|nr:MAG: hypothetical protein CEN89_319 [Candidatus Berkelbacteria bacterium Licking1014_7]
MVIMDIIMWVAIVGFLLRGVRCINLGMNGSFES